MVHECLTIDSAQFMRSSNINFIIIFDRMQMQSKRKPHSHDTYQIANGSRAERRREMNVKCKHLWREIAKQKKTKS